MPFSNVPTLVIAGVARPFISLASVAISRQIKGRASARVVVFDLTQSYRPEHGASIVISDTGTTFYGTIDKVTEEYREETNFIQYRLDCLDYSSIFDHRFVFRRYPSGATFAAIVADINTNFLDGEGFNLTHVDGFGAINSELAFDGVSVTQAFNQITDLAGEQWWVEDHSLYFKNLANAPASPFAITASSKNWRKLSIERTRSASYRNVQYVRTGASLAPGLISDTLTANGTQFFFPTRFNLTSAPTVTVAGVAQTVKEFGVDAYPGSGYYWTRGGSGVQEGHQIPASAGAAVVISYGSTSTNIVSAQDNSAIAARAAIEGGSGKWEALDDASNVDKLLVAQELATGLLARSGSIPVTIRYETDVAGLAPGQKQTVQLPLNNIDTVATGAPYYITQIDSQLLEAPFPSSNLYFRHRVTLSLTLDQGNWVAWWENIFADHQSNPPVDLTKVDTASINTTELQIDPVTKKLGINTIDSADLVNVAALASDGLLVVSGKLAVRVNGSEVTIDPFTKELKINGVSAAKLNPGTTIGASVVFAGTLAAGVGYFGPVFASQVTAGQFNGLSLVLTKNGVTTTIDNVFDSNAVEYYGVKVNDLSTGDYSIHTSKALYIFNGSGQVRAQLQKAGSGSGETGVCSISSAAGGFVTMTASARRVVVGDGSGSDVRVLYNGITMNGTSIILVNASGQWSGNGVACPSFGVQCAGVNPFVAGVQYFGDSKDVGCQVFIGGVWNTCFFVDTLGGPALRAQRMRGGIYTGLTN